MFWCCPECYGALRAGQDTLQCVDCEARYPVIAGIPDFRSDDAAWIDFEEDRRRAIVLDEIVAEQGLEAALINVFRNSRGFSEKKSGLRTRQVLSGISKSEHQLGGWLSGLEKGPVLEVGSGPGQMVVAAARRGFTLAGLDVSLEWLAFSKHWVRSYGAEPVLACGMGEKLPVSSAAVRSVISLDVIEHVGDQNAYMAEIGRVLRPGGRFHLVTPNRYSLSPEPHVGVWGVGYLPVPWQAAWVKLVSGQSYEYTRLLSKGEARRLIRRAARIEAEFVFPPIAAEEVALFPAFKAGLARIYNRIVRSRLLAPVMPLIGAYFQITGTKPREIAN